ncbi:hypothetical protein [Methylobacterium mesophilicum]|uniref:hypothetical protein n=1 Tax=Methylobacterium mesophilicum TaxID=39956 RepID=UPI002F360578
MAASRTKAISLAGSPATHSHVRIEKRSAGARRRAAAAQPITARDREIQPAAATVPCPYELGTFIPATVNRQVDVLAAERARGDITDAQLFVGRLIQAVYERGSGARLGSGGWDISGSRDQTIAHELAIIYSVEDAERVRKFSARFERAVGSVGARFLRAILTEGWTFRTYAAARGKGSEKGTAQVAAHFRFLLEGLTAAQHTARGVARPTPDDVYLADAERVPARIAAALARDEAPEEVEAPPA